MQQQNEETKKFTQEAQDYIKKEKDLQFLFVHTTEKVDQPSASTQRSQGSSKPITVTLEMKGQLGNPPENKDINK